MSIFRRIETELVNLYSAFSRTGWNWKFSRKSRGARIWYAGDERTRDAHFDGTAAFTVGEDIYFPHECHSENTAMMNHEMTHVEQQRHWGILFPVMYWIETARVGYRANCFEREARAAEIPATTSSQRKPWTYYP